MNFQEQNPGDKLTIPQWYAKRRIFVTGATGFMGKVLIEKLLRCCPQVEAIYILIRPKRGKSPKERLDEFFNFPIFDKIKEDGRNSMGKVVCVSGDVIEENLGLSAENLEILTNSASVFFHMAANVRFDQPLKPEIIFNLKGTLNTLRVAEKMKKLVSYIYVSTTFCHCNEMVLEERFYPAPQDPMKMLDLITWLDEDILEKMTPYFLKNSPNTYAYTKCLSEQLVSSCSNKFPIAIARPSIVINAWKEPLPGWVDNLNGPTGIVVAAGKGVMRSMYCKEEINCDGIPVDLAINGLIIVAKELGCRESATEEGTMFVNLSIGEENPINWGTCLSLARKHFYANPFSVMLWYPDGSPKQNYLLHVVTVFFTQILPAYFIDFMLMLARQKTFMVKVQNKIKVGLDVLQYYTTRDWEFPNNNLQKLRSKLTESDRKTFYTDCRELDWDEYFLTLILGTRKYCVKEDPSTLPRARRTFKKLYYLHLLVTLILYGLLFWFFYVCTVKIFDGLNTFTLPTLPAKQQIVPK